MQRKFWIAVAVGSLLVGVLGGWLSATYRAEAQNERYTLDALSHARYAQAKERATLIRLLEGKDIGKAEDLLYILLGSNLKDYARSVDSKERAKSCELSEILGPSFVGATSGARPVEPESRRILLEAIRLATTDCGSKVK